MSITNTMKIAVAFTIVYYNWNIDNFYLVIKDGIITETFMSGTYEQINIEKLLIRMEQKTLKLDKNMSHVKCNSMNK